MTRWYVLAPVSALILGYVAVLLVLLFMVAGPALSAAADTVVPVSPWYQVVRPYLVELVSVVASGAIGWLALTINKALGVSIDAKYREALHSALMTGVKSALLKVDVAAGSMSVDVKSQVIADAIRWAQQSVPQAIKGLDATPEKMAELANAKLVDVLGKPA